MRLPWQKKPPELTTLDKLKRAVDDVNRLTGELPNPRVFRPFVEKGSIVTGDRPRLVLGYWLSDAAKTRFVIAYESPTDGD